MTVAYWVTGDPIDLEINGGWWNQYHVSPPLFISLLHLQGIDLN